MPLPDLARSLIDAPRWVETRFMLQAGEAVVTGLSGDRRRFVAASTRWPLIAVVGRPDPEFIRAAAERASSLVTVLCAEEDAERTGAALPLWQRSGAGIFGWPGGRRPEAAPGPDEARLLAPDELPATSRLRATLHEELATAADYSPIAAGLADGQPVAFCYASAITESLWDVSIDTLEPHRRRGHAARAFRLLADTMARSGKQPVWGAEDDNEASLGLARKLGFVPAERLALFKPPL